jgi:hypothetical protein
MAFFGLKTGFCCGSDDNKSMYGDPLPYPDEEPFIPPKIAPKPVKEEPVGGCCKSRTCKMICCGICCFVTPFLLLALYLLIEVVIYVQSHQDFQPWILQYPNSITAKVFLTPVELLDSVYVGRTETFLSARESYGNNFAAAGMVWLGSFDDVAKTVTSPQARTLQLGEHPLLYSALPDTERSRLVFLLSLSDKEAGGSGAHSAFRSCFNTLLIDNPEVEKRRLDSTAQSLLDRLTKDYDELDHNNVSAPFFSRRSRGLIPFAIHYLHYVMFGIDVENDEILNTLEDFLVGEGQIGHYFYPHGYFMSQTDLINKVADIYMDSPALKNFKENQTQYFNMTKRELAVLAVSIMRIAGVQGFLQTSKIVLGAFKMQKYPGVEERFDQKTVWDKLDLDDHEEIQQYIMECIRLDTPVSVTHHVATEPFEVKMKGGTYTYPEGTKIAVPLGLGNLDPDFWGEDVYHFDLKREKLKDNLLSFHSRGDDHAGRECPGKALVMKTLTLMLTDIGKVRRRP